MIAGAFLAITCQPIKQESCSNPLRIWEFFLFQLKIFISILGLGFSVGDVISGVVFAFLAKFTWSWSPTQLAIFLVQNFSESLDSLMGFLVYLKPKLWLKNPYFGKNKKVTQKVWTQQKIELERYSNLLRTRGVLWFRMKIKLSFGFEAFVYVQPYLIRWL